jgi:hypothetical protein
VTEIEYGIGLCPFASALHVRTAISCGPALVTFCKVPQPVSGTRVKAAKPVFLSPTSATGIQLSKQSAPGWYLQLGAVGGNQTMARVQSASLQGSGGRRPKSVTRKFPGFPLSNTTLVCTAHYSPDKHQSRLLTHLLRC